MSILQFAFAIVIGLVILGVLVFIHEFGHFIAAKALKFDVKVAAIGFGRALLRFKRGETEYRINAIPFGGYVAMASDSPIGETGGGDNEFNSHPIWQRAVVAVAGPAMNFAAAVLTLWIMFISGVDRPAYLDDPTIGAVVKNSAADSAGFLAGDSIVAINGAQINTWEEAENILAQQQRDGYVIAVRRGGAALELRLSVERTGAKLSASPTGGLLPARFPPIIGGVAAGSAADKILAAGDTLISVNGAAVGSFDKFAMIVREYAPEDGALRITFKRGNEIKTSEVTPLYDEQRERYLLGVEASPEITRVIRYNPIAAVKPTLKKSWEYTVMIFDVLGKLTSGKVSANQLAGPLNIIPVSGIMAFQGLSTILNFMALIGINLGVLNLMPLVITDGGLLMFLGIEAIRKKPLEVKTQMLINKIFMALFLALFVFVSFNDVQRLPDFFKMLR